MHNELYDGIEARALFKIKKKTFRATNELFSRAISLALAFAEATNNPSVLYWEVKRSISSFQVMDRYTVPLSIQVPSSTHSE